MAPSLNGKMPVESFANKEDEEHLSRLAVPKALNFLCSLKEFSNGIVSDEKEYLEWMQDILYSKSDVILETRFTDKNTQAFHKNVRNSTAIYSSLHLSSIRNLLDRIWYVFDVEVEEMEGQFEEYLKGCVEHAGLVKNIYLKLSEELNEIYNRAVNGNHTLIENLALKEWDEADASDEARENLLLTCGICGSVSAIFNSCVGTVISLVQLMMEKCWKDQLPGVTRKLYDLKEEREKILDFKQNPLVTFDKSNARIEQFCEDLEYFHRFFIRTKKSPGARKIFIEMVNEEQRVLVSNLSKCMEIIDKFVDKNTSLEKYALDEWLPKVNSLHNYALDEWLPKVNDASSVQPLSGMSIPSTEAALLGSNLILPDSPISRISSLIQPLVNGFTSPTNNLGKLEPSNSAPVQPLIEGFTSPTNDFGTSGPSNSAPVQPLVDGFTSPINDSGASEAHGSVAMLGLKHERMKEVLTQRFHTIRL